MKIRALALVALLALGACAPKSYVVLLEDEDGTTGALVVSNEQGQERIRTAGAAIDMDDASRPPRSPWQVTVDKIQEVFGSVFAMRPPEHATYTLYFEFGNADLAKESQATLDALLEDVRDRPAPDARIEGHADRVDSVGSNDALSLLRAFVVEDILVEAGVPPERIRIAAHGESRPAVPTADEVREPLNRRVVVSVR